MPEAPRTTAEVVNVWSKNLSAGARRMLDVLINLKGEGINKEELMSSAGLANSGSAGTYLSNLRSAQLAIVERGGIVKANRETLFL